MSKRRVLVTGATGTVGSNVVAELLGHGETIVVRGVSRQPLARDRLIAAGAEAVDIDFRDVASVNRALADVDTLFLVTGYSIDMLLQSRLLLRAAVEAGVCHVVHLGALSDASMNFAPHIWHAYVEAMIRDERLTYTNLHPNFFMEGISTTAKRNKGRLFSTVGDVKVGWIAAEDIAAVATAAIRAPEKHSGKSYPLATDARTYGEIAELLSRRLGKPFQVVVPPSEKVLPALLSSGMEPTYAAGLAEFVQATARNELPLATQVFDNIREITGHAPIDWTTFIERNVDKFDYE